MATLGRPLVFHDVVEEHFDELDFLLEHREANVFTPDWTVDDLAFVEERAEAHLDGLRLAELHGVELAASRLCSGTTFSAAAAALVLLESGDADSRQQVLAALRCGEQPIVEGVRVALRHSLADALADELSDLAAGDDVLAAAAAADVLAFRRRRVAAPAHCLRSEDAHLRSLALGVAGRTGALGEQDLEAALQHPEPAVRRTALYEAARCGLRSLHADCRRAAARENDADPECVRFLGVLGNEDDLQLLRRALQRPPLAAAAVDALGAFGSVVVVPWLLDLMSDEVLGSAAARAYRRLTGGDVEGEKPFPRAAGGSEDDDDDALPPNPARACADWKRRQPAMPAERSWQNGLPLEAAALPSGWRRLTLQSRRDAWARLRSRGSTPDLELEALVRSRAAGAADGAS